MAVQETDFAKLEALVARAATAQSLVQHRIAGASLQESFCIASNANYAISRGGLDACAHVLKQAQETLPRRQAAFALCNLTGSVERARYAGEHSLLTIVLDALARDDNDEATVAYLWGAISHLAASNNAAEWNTLTICQAVQHACSLISHPILSLYICKAVCELAKVSIFRDEFTKIEVMYALLQRSLSSTFPPSQREALRAVAAMSHSRVFVNTFLSLGYLPVLIGLDTTDVSMARNLATILFAIAQHGYTDSIKKGASAIVAQLCLSADPQTRATAANALSVVAQDLESHQELIQLGVVAAAQFGLASCTQFGNHNGALRLLACLSVSVEGRAAVTNNEILSLIDEKCDFNTDASTEYISLLIGNAMLHDVGPDLLMSSRIVDLLFKYCSRVSFSTITTEQATCVKCTLISLVQLSKHSEYHIPLMMRGALGLASKFLSISDHNIRVLAACALANLLLNPSTHEYLYRSGVIHSMVALLDDAFDEVVQPTAAALISIVRSPQRGELMPISELSGCIVRQLSRRTLPALLHSLLNLLALSLEDVRLHEHIITTELCEALLSMTRTDNFLLPPTLQCLGSFMLSQQGQTCLSVAFADLSSEDFRRFCATVHSTEGEARVVALRCLNNFATLSPLRRLFSEVSVLRLCLAGLDGPEDIKYTSLAALANLARDAAGLRILLEENAMSKCANLLRLRRESKRNQQLASRIIILLSSSRSRECTQAVKDSGVIQLATNLISLGDRDLQYFGSAILLALSWNKQAISTLVATPETLACIHIMGNLPDTLSNRLVCSAVCTLSFLPSARKILMRTHSTDMLRFHTRWLASIDPKVRRMAAASIANFFETIHIPLLHAPAYLSLIAQVIQSEKDTETLFECLRAISNALQRPTGLFKLAQSIVVQCLLLTDVVGSRDTNSEIVLLAALTNLLANQRSDSTCWSEIGVCKGVAAAFFKKNLTAAHMLWANVCANAEMNDGVAAINFPVQYHSALSPWVANCIVRGRIDVAYEDYESGIASSQQYPLLIHTLEAGQAMHYHASYAKQHYDNARRLLHAIQKIELPQTLDTHRLVHGLMANGTRINTPITPTALHEKFAHMLFAPFEADDDQLVWQKLAAIGNIVAHQLLDWNVLLGSGLLSHVFVLLSKPDIQPTQLQQVYRCITGIAFNAPKSAAKNFGLSMEHHLNPLFYALQEGGAYDSAEILSGKVRAIACIVRYLGTELAADKLQGQLTRLLASLLEVNYWSVENFRRSVVMLLFAICENDTLHAPSEMAIAILQLLSDETYTDMHEMTAETMWMYVTRQTTAVLLVSEPAQACLHHAVLRMQSKPARLSTLRCLESLQRSFPHADWAISARNLAGVVAGNFEAFGDNNDAQVKGAVIRWLALFVQSPKSLASIKEDALQMLPYLFVQLSHLPQPLTVLDRHVIRLVNNLLCESVVGGLLASSGNVSKLLQHYDASNDALVSCLLGTAARSAEVVQHMIINDGVTPSRLLVKPSTPKLAYYELQLLTNFSGHEFVEDFSDAKLVKMLQTLLREHNSDTTLTQFALEAIANIASWRTIWQEAGISTDEAVNDCAKLVCAILSNQIQGDAHSALQAAHAIMANTGLRPLAYSKQLLDVVLHILYETTTSEEIGKLAAETAASLLCVTPLQDLIAVTLPVKAPAMTIAFTNLWLPRIFTDAVVVGNLLALRASPNDLSEALLDQFFVRVHEQWRQSEPELQRILALMSCHILCEAVAIDCLLSLQRFEFQAHIIDWMFTCGRLDTRHCAQQTIGYLAGFPKFRPMLSLLLLRDYWQGHFEKKRQYNQPHERADALIYRLLSDNLLCRVAMQRRLRRPLPLADLVPNGLNAKAVDLANAADPLASLLAFQMCDFGGHCGLGWASPSIQQLAKQLQDVVIKRSSVVHVNSFNDSLCNMLMLCSIAAAGCALLEESAGQDEGIPAVLRRFFTTAKIAPSDMASFRAGKLPQECFQLGWVSTQTAASTCVFGRTSVPGCHEHDKGLLLDLFALSQAAQHTSSEGVEVAPLLLLLMHTRSSKYIPHRYAVQLVANNCLFAGTTMQALFHTLQLWNLCEKPVKGSKPMSFDTETYDRIFRASIKRGIAVPFEILKLTLKLAIRELQPKDLATISNSRFAERVVALHDVLQSCAAYSKPCNDVQCAAFSALRIAQQRCSSLWLYSNGVELLTAKLPDLHLCHELCGSSTMYAHNVCHSCSAHASPSKPLGLHTSAAAVVAAHLGTMHRCDALLFTHGSLDCFATVALRCSLDKYLLDHSIACGGGNIKPVIQCLLYLMTVSAKHEIQTIGICQLLSSRVYRDLLQCLDSNPESSYSAICNIIASLEYAPTLLAPLLPCLVMVCAQSCQPLFAELLANAYLAFSRFDRTSYQFASDTNLPVIECRLAPMLTHMYPGVRRVAAALLQRLAVSTSIPSSVRAWVEESTRGLLSDIDPVTVTIAKSALLISLDHQIVSMPLEHQFPLAEFMLAISMPMARKRPWDASLVFTSTTLSGAGPLAFALADTLCSLLQYMCSDTSAAWQQNSRRGLHISIIWFLVSEQAFEHNVSADFLYKLLTLTGTLPESNDIKNLVAVAIALSPRLKPDLKRKLTKVWTSNRTLSGDTGLLYVAVALLCAEDKRQQEMLLDPSMTVLKATIEARSGLSPCFYLACAAYCYISQGGNRHTEPFFRLPEHVVDMKSRISWTMALFALVCMPIPAVISGYGYSRLMQVAADVIKLGVPDMVDIACVLTAKTCRQLVKDRRTLPIVDTARVIQLLESSPHLPASGALAILEGRRLLSAGGTLGNVEDLIKAM